MMMTWYRKKSIQLVLSAWKTMSRFITCNRAMTCQGQRLAIELGCGWVSLLLSPRIVQHLMSSLSEQIYVGLKKTCLGLPAPSLTGSSTLHPPRLPPWPTCVSRLCRTTVCTQVFAHTVPFAWRDLPSLPLPSGEYLLIFYDSSPASTPLCSLPDHPLEESTTSFFGPLMYPECTSLITPVPPSSYLDDFWA